MSNSSIKKKKKRKTKGTFFFFLKEKTTTLLKPLFVYLFILFINLNIKKNDKSLFSTNLISLLLFKKKCHFCF